MVTLMQLLSHECVRRSDAFDSKIPFANRNASLEEAIALMNLWSLKVRTLLSLSNFNG